MWGVIAQCGTGMAVAGLSATYYVLARQNAQMERTNRDHEIDEMSSGDKETMTSGRTLNLSASQMLLKKELDCLARESGHSFGLNIIDNKECHAERVPTLYSDIGIRKIVSRVQTNFIPLKSPEKEESYTTANGSSEKTALRENVEQRTSSSMSESNYNEEEGHDNQSIFDLEEFSILEISEEEDAENNEMLDQVPIERESLIQRTKSPIVYYKNPGFGKRFACKIQESDLHLLPEMSLPSGRFNSFNKRDIKDDAGLLNWDQNYKDSTQFLFPPVLSESKLSICEEDGAQEMLNDEDCDEKDFDQPIDELDENALLTEGLSRMDEIRDYNLQLQMTQDVRNTDDDGFLEDTPKPELYEKAPEEKIFFKEVSYVDYSDAEKVVQDSEPNLEKEYKTIIPSEGKPFLEVLKSNSCVDVDRENSSVMQRIPENSWISLPARMYADSEHFSLHLIIFLSLVVIVFGSLGKFFIALADWFQLGYQIADEEENKEMLDY